MTTETESTDGKVIVPVDRDLEDLIPGYMDNRRSDISAMTAAVEQRDFETVCSLAHCLKGCGAGYGFNEISEIGINIEQAARAQNRGDVQKWIDYLAEYLTKVEIVYE